MATLREYRSDIMLILEKSKLSVNSRIYPRHIDFLIHKYRADYIKREYQRNRQVPPEVLQDMGVLELTPVNSGDDPLVPITSMQLGKIRLPQVVSIPDDKGYYRIANSSKQSNYYPIPMPRFFELVEDSILAQFDYYFRVNEQLYVKYCRDLINPVLVLFNPLDGFIMQSEYIDSGDLVVGTNYTVYVSQIIYNGTPYLPGNTFTAVTGVLVFTGTGKVKLTTQKRAWTQDDPYPIATDAGRAVAMDILTKEFQIEPQMIGNLRNESQDELSVLKDTQ